MTTILRPAPFLALLLAGACATPGHPADARTRSVVVTGAVERAGEVPLPEDSTLLEVVLAAAPTEGVADLSRVELRRPDPPVNLTVDIETMLLTGDTTWNVRLQPADRVYVPALEEGVE